MVRFWILKALTILDTQTTSGWVDLRRAAGALMLIPAGWTGGASVSFEVAYSEDGDGAALLTDTDGVTTLSQVVTADRWVPIPEHAMKAGWVRLVAAGAVTRDEAIQFASKA